MSDAARLVAVVRLVVAVVGLVGMKESRMSRLMSFENDTTNTTAHLGPSRSIGALAFSIAPETFPTIASFVEDIADWDLPDADTARALAIRVFPRTTPYLMVQYRESTRSTRTFRDINNQHRRYRHVATVVGTGIVTIRPSGPFGAIIVRLKPEAAALLLGERLRCFADVKIDLSDVFNAQDISLLEEKVSEVSTSLERISVVARFLHANARRCDPDPVIFRAATRLRHNPSLRVQRLAADLQVSERHVSRKFQTIFGVSPKQFARFARIEKVLAARSAGSTWVDIAYRCGFADQAHMINDFAAVIGAPPERALLPPSADKYCEANASSGYSISYDHFVR